MKKRRVLWLLAPLGIFLLSFTPPADRFFELAKNLEIFASLFKEVNNLYVDEVNPNKMARDGIETMLSTLDPYTNYIPEDEVEDSRTRSTGQYGGIGATTINIGHRIVVSMVYENYPAFKNGLRIGDEIVKLNGIELSKYSEEESGRLMKGQVGTSVKVSVKRFGHPNLIDLEFTREKIKINVVPFSGLIAPEIGLVQLTEFTSECSKEVRSAIVQLKSQGAKKIILDLRGNPGGHLNEAVAICNLFIPKGKIVVSTKGKSENIDYDTKGEPLDEEMPLVILINRGSASASEIVAGTLQDYDRAVIVGEKSFGKGLVQMGKPFLYNSYIKITSAKYYTPSGRCIQALDYSHRKADGTVISVHDSLRKEFKTQNGRKVFDGGGITPDIAMAGSDQAPLAVALIQQGFIFDYATEYAARHEKISAAKSFSLSDTEYSDFINWMKSKNFTYETQLEKHLKELQQIAVKERSISEIKPQIEKLSRQLADLHVQDFTHHKRQIKSLLEAEIVSRYYLERGAAEYKLQANSEVSKAVEILNNVSQYKKTLMQP
jgi:carboxyl-terminal processing protease